jgi:hypothetical protein
MPREKQAFESNKICVLQIFQGIPGLFLLLFLAKVGETVSSRSARL